MKDQVIQLQYYHGTDLRIATMSKERRQNLFDDCMKTIKYLAPRYEDYCKAKHDPYGWTNVLKTEIEDEEEYLSLLEGLSMSSCVLNDDAKDYEYGDFYITTNHSFAMGYALKAGSFGEIGHIAFELIRGRQNIEIDIDDKDSLEAMEDLADFACRPSQPVVFKIDLRDLDLNLLTERNGDVIEPDSFFNNYDLRYSGDIQLDPSKAEPLPVNDEGHYMVLTLTGNFNEMDKKIERNDPDEVLNLTRLKEGDQSIYKNQKTARFLERFTDFMKKANTTRHE